MIGERVLVVEFGVGWSEECYVLFFLFVLWWYLFEYFFEDGFVCDLVVCGNKVWSCLCEDVIELSEEWIVWSGVVVDEYFVDVESIMFCYELYDGVV